MHCSKDPKYHGGQSGLSIHAGQRGWTLDIQQFALRYTRCQITIFSMLNGERKNLVTGGGRGRTTDLHLQPDVRMRNRGFGFSRKSAHNLRMPRYEYKKVVARPGQIEERLRALGEDGWRTVSVTGRWRLTVVLTRTAAPSKALGQMPEYGIRAVTGDGSVTDFSADRAALDDVDIVFYRGNDVTGRLPRRDLATLDWHVGSYRAGIPWSEDEDAHLKRAVELGIAREKIAHLHCRSIGAISTQLKRLAATDDDLRDLLTENLAYERGGSPSQEHQRDEPAAPGGSDSPSVRKSRSQKLADDFEEQIDHFSGSDQLVLQDAIDLLRTPGVGGIPGDSNDRRRRTAMDYNKGRRNHVDPPMLILADRASAELFAYTSEQREILTLAIDLLRRHPRSSRR